jgi:hypothetical protein
MNTEVRAPGEKFDLEEHSLSHYIDARYKHTLNCHEHYLFSSFTVNWDLEL